MGLGVPAQGGGVGEGAVAGAAHVGLLSGVDPLVPLQSAELSEVLLTEHALVRTVACVYLQVLAEGVPLREASSTVLTLKRFNPGVDVRMVPQIFTRGKAFTTGLAHKRLFSCVRADVVGQHVLLGKARAAHVTGKWSFSSVCPVVHLQSSFLGELGVALGALERFGPGVDPLVQE